MDAPTSHPSCLELDRLHLGSAAPGVREHVDGCETCRAHLRTLEEPVPLPAWAKALARAEVAPKPEQRPFWSTWRWPVLVPLALAAIVLAVVIPRRPPPTVIDQGEIGEKGSPSLALYVKRGAQVFAWDGQTPVQPGDRLRLEVASAGFGFVTVTAGDASGAALYAGAIDPQRAAYLPESWAVDAQPGSEKLVVLLSQHPLTPTEITSATARAERDAAVWVTALTLAKATPAP